MQTSMLSSLVKGLNRTPEISGGLRALGRRHEGYQATPADYGKVANALLVTLEEFLGDDFTADVRGAWVTVFGKISGLMIQGVEGRCAAADDLSVQAAAPSDRNPIAKRQHAPASTDRSVQRQFGTTRL
jgi:hypothetical protein